MKREDVKHAIIAESTINDERFWITTNNGFIGFCPRNSVSADYDAQSDKLQLRHPVSVLEFLHDDCRHLALSNVDKARIYLAAQTVHAELAGLEEDAQKYRDQHDRIVAAKKTAGEVISESGIQRALIEYERQQPIPF